MKIAFQILLVGFVLLTQTFTPFEIGSAKADEPLADTLISTVSTPTAAIQSAVAKSLPYLEKRGQWWMDKKECMSCHRTSFMAWSHIEAHAAGIKVNRAKVNEWIDWSHTNLFQPFPEKDQKYPGEQTIVRNLSGAAQMLALARNWESTEQQIANQQLIVDELLKGQEENGSWTPRGQLPMQKRKGIETTHVITIWNAIALHHFESEVDTKSAVESAAKFVNQYEDGESAEWFALRSMFAAKLGQAETSAKFLDRLKSSQNEDGGWGWKLDEESDALATAQVIYSMLESNVPADTESIQNAVGYLVETQTEKGLWLVNGTKTKSMAEPQETSNYWGTAWSVIALSKTLASMK